MLRTLYWFALAAVAVVLISRVVSVDVDELSASFTSWTADTPWLIGVADDRFSYDGSAVSRVDGTATLRVSASSDQGEISVLLPVTDDLLSRLPHEPLGDHVELRSSVGHGDALWVDRRIHSATGVGDSRLPETHALIAGGGAFSLLVDGRPADRMIHGFWSLGHAVRRPDGSIRNQGLIFSPLLRDRTIFSDPDRLEITVLLYEAADAEGVILHLVFPLDPSAVQWTELG